MFINVWLGPSDMNLLHSLWMNWTLIGQENINDAALESWRLIVDYELICQFINYYDRYSVAFFLIDSKSYGYMLIT